MIKKSPLLLLIITILFLVSCQKEINWSTNGGSGTISPGNLLVKSVAKNGPESVVTDYTYNTNKKIVNEKITGISQGINAGNEVRYYRDRKSVV